MAKGKQVPANEPDEKAEALRKVEEALQGSDFKILQPEEFEDFEDIPDPVAEEIVVPKGKSKPAIAKSKKPYHEEWTCQVKQGDKGPTFEKLKKLRSNITMTEDMAHILNEGLLHGGNNFGSMYFLQD
jgi:hypothetical protein